jgi:hypothetical protein
MNRKEVKNYMNMINKVSTSVKLAFAALTVGVMSVVTSQAQTVMPDATAISDIDPSSYITAALVVVGAVLAGLIGIKLIKKFANKATLIAGGIIALGLSQMQAAMPAATPISGIDPSTYITAALTVVGAVLAGMIGIKLIKKFANRAT